MKFNFLFGPVISRRIGISLGVDLIPMKYCSMNCIYCEIGRTTNLTLKRDEYIPADKIIYELKDYLSGNPALDYITFSGAGEPTLNSRIGEIVSFLKNGYPQYKLALITNSSLLSDAEVRKELRQIDLIMPSLDAVSQDIFVKINRPATGLNTDKIIEGIKAFRQESKAIMLLEIFIVPNLNDTIQELKKLKEAVLSINPDKVQLNSLDRPGTEKWVTKENYNDLQKIVDFFQPIETEIISRKPDESKLQKLLNNEGSKDTNEDEVIAENIKSTIRRRPSTVEELASIFHKSVDEIVSYLKPFVDSGEIVSEIEESEVFYRMNDYFM